ncbi:hypothetical protein [Burkholderia territorii]|uniref:hypothetical protein n=1 Tax=Burkholderia territorii TaxID=1503055 RepID=UPI0012D99984|nr:hypothetical protein [Burkholderia territorii]
MKSLTMLMTFVILRIAADIALAFTIARLSAAIAQDSERGSAALWSPLHPLMPHHTHFSACRRVQRRPEHPRRFHRTAHLIALLTAVCLVALPVDMKSGKRRFAEAAIWTISLNDSAFLGIDGYPYD